jgi:hypothetical protein
MPVKEFISDDDGYRRWLSENRTGFVVNMYRDMDASRYSMLHRARCRFISDYSGSAEPGGFTERDYVKVCAESIEELRDWVRAHGGPHGTFKSRCSKCGPS